LSGKVRKSLEKKYKNNRDREIEILEEILRWIKVTSIPQVKKLLLDLLQSDEEKIAYHRSNGRSSREVARFAGVRHGAIAKWWKIWIRAGIAESISVRRGKRAKRIFSLEDFGIEVPSLKKIKHKKEKSEVSTQEGPKRGRRES
jgi:hypothetical protein